MNDEMIEVPGVARCRICGFVYVPELAEDRESHEAEHRRILWGGWPYEIRELIKQAGEEALETEGNDAEAKATRELGKRAVVYGWWARAIGNGIPENEFEPYFLAHLAYMDAVESRSEEEIEAAGRAIRRWVRYGG